jgi:hypothetical protein
MTPRLLPSFISLVAALAIGCTVVSTAPPPAAPAPGPAPGPSGLTLEAGVDLPGYDMRRLSTTTPEGCRDACVAEAQCLGFTYVKNAVGDCFLKSSVPQRGQCDRCVSGIKVAAGK